MENPQKIEKQKEEAGSIKKKLENKSVVIETKADKGKIYGSITTKKIVAAIKESHKVDVQENAIRLTDKIKQTGNYDITISVDTNTGSVPGPGPNPGPLSNNEDGEEVNVKMEVIAYKLDFKEVEASTEEMS